MFEALPCGCSLFGILALLWVTWVRCRAVDEHEIDLWQPELLKVRFYSCDSPTSVACTIDFSCDEDLASIEPRLTDGGPNLVLIVI